MYSLKNSTDRRESLESRDAGIEFLMCDPRLELDALDRARVMDRKLLDADRIEPRRDRYGLLPMRRLATVAKHCLALQQSVRDNRILCGAVMMNSLVAFAEGWSIIGSQSRALFGQFHEKKQRSLYLLTPL